MVRFTLYDPKQRRRFCDRIMSFFEADIKNNQLREQGRAQRWIPKEEVPADADASLIGLGVWK
jgi:hypothetical protein